MTSSERRALIPLLKRVLNDTINHGTKSTARYWLHRLQKPRSKPSAQRKEAKAAQHREEMGTIYGAVFRRADGKCENCGLLWRDPPLQLDHWLHGIGRRRQRQAVENCWALCPPCHHHRTYHMPSAAHWNERFAVFAARHGYPTVPHIEHAELPWKAAP